jgi:hypothetical protein
MAVADPGCGSCCDGLGPQGVNANQGAESTLAWLTATEVVRNAGLRALVPDGGRRRGMDDGGAEVVGDYAAATGAVEHSE